MNEVKSVRAGVRKHHKIDTAWSGSWFRVQLYAALALRPDQRLDGTFATTSGGSSTESTGRCL
eukprot:2500291-Prorocentrum_lima.AAC.1